MKNEEAKSILGNIKDLKEKLVRKATEKVNLEQHDTIEIARRYHRQDRRGLLNLLKEEMAVLETIEKAEELEPNKEVEQIKKDIKEIN